MAHFHEHMKDIHLVDGFETRTSQFLLQYINAERATDKLRDGLKLYPPIFLYPVIIR